jgi:ribosome-binding factor A
MSDRVVKANKLIQEELSKIIFREVEFPDALITLTRVETTGNLIESKIYISVMPASKEANVFKNLNKRIYYLQQLLNERLRIRPMPKIIFQKEKETERAGKIEEILEKLKPNRR